MQCHFAAVWKKSIVTSVFGCSFVPCSEKIHLAVTEMASLFPKVNERVLWWYFASRYPARRTKSVLSASLRDQRWMQYVLPWSSWGPVRPAFRWSVVKQHPPTPRPAQWTTSCSPSRSSSARTTSPKLPSSWSPSLPARKNSDPPGTLGFSGQGQRLRNGRGERH